MGAREIARKLARQAVGALFAGVRHEAKQSTFGRKNRLENGP
jgi:hypothetical protein